MRESLPVIACLFVVCSLSLASASAAPKRTITEHTVLKLDGHIVTYHPRPRYPYEARSQHMIGHSIIALYVGADGVVSDAKVVQSTGHDLLDKEAVRAGKRWRFRPERAPFVANLPLTFEMKDMPSPSTTPDT